MEQTGQGREEGSGPLVRLAAEMGRAAHSGWGPTARLIAQLVVLAGAFVLVAIAAR